MGGVWGDVSVTDFRPPLKMYLLRCLLWTWEGSNIQIALPLGFFPEGVKTVVYILCTSPLLTTHEIGGDIIHIYIYIFIS